MVSASSRPKTRFLQIGGGFPGTLQGSAARKGGSRSRMAPAEVVESLETQLEMASRWFAVAGKENRSTELRIMLTRPAIGLTTARQDDDLPREEQS